MNDSNPVEQWRLFAAAALSLLVLLVWQSYFVKPAVEAPRPAAQEDVVDVESPPLPVERPPEASEPLAAQGPESSAESTPVAPEEREPIVGERERLVEVAGEGLRAELSNRGAQLRSFVPGDHVDVEGEPLDLVRRRRGPEWDFALAGPPEIEALNEALFAVEETVEDGVRWVRFEHRSELGEASKAFGFRPDGLLEVEITVPGRSDWSVLLGPGVRNPSEVELSNRFARRSAVYRTQGESADTEAPDKAKEPKVVSGDGLEWAGLEDSYFLTVLIPETPVAEVRFEPMLVRREEGGLFSFSPLPEELSDDEEKLTREFRLALVPGRESWSGQAYLGAKDYDHLRSLRHGLEETVNWGMFGFLARPLLYGLRWIHENIVPNYGWSIILMTLLIKIVLFPLTHKGYVSMQKMQELNPKVQAIRSKYKSKLKDKQGRPNPEAQRKMNEEVMALYKTEGVNPAGGCLPLLLQMPVLLAFYNLLSTAIEVRGAPWILWIADLSAPDPYRVLPIVMGASQFIQQRLTPASGDPVQRRIFAMMPIVFTILFMGFPSGLVLYWLTNNVLQIFQQAGYKAWKKRQGEA